MESTLPAIAFAAFVIAQFAAIVAVQARTYPDPSRRSPPRSHLTSTTDPRMEISHVCGNKV
jgi:hypothetical protein